MHTPFQDTPLDWIVLEWPGSAAARPEGSCPSTRRAGSCCARTTFAAVETDGSYRTVDQPTGQCRIT